MDKAQKKEIASVFQGVYSRFYNTYRGKFGPSDDREKVAHCKFWIDSLFQAEINGDMIQAASEHVLTSKQFSSSPPTPQQFIEVAKKIALNAGSGSSPTDKFFYPIYEKMRERYKALWDKDVDSINSPSYIFWRDEIKKLGVSRASVEKAFDMIPSIPEYITYPPGINEVSLMIKIIHEDKGTPFVHEALELALGKDDDVHPLIKYARYRFGSQELRRNDKSRVKRDFNTLYTGAVLKYLEGDLDLRMFQKKTERVEKEEPLAKEDVLKSLDELLNSI